ncbi:MAG TPA: rod shape-determining protein MreD [Gemmatimonadales bacterium]
MSIARTVRALILFTALIALHFGVRPLFATRANVDFLIIALLLAAVRVRPGAAALIGFLLGLLVDSLKPGTFGAAALGMTLVGYGASWLKPVFFADNLPLNAFFFFVGKWGFDLVYLTVGRRLHGTELVMQLLLWSPLAAALTALTGVLLLLVARPLTEARAT